MDYARHEAEMRQSADDGADTRAHLEAAARKGSAEAIAALRGPEFPEELEYLWGWVMELHGRSGVGMAGLAPLTYSTIAAWSELTGAEPGPLDVEALMALDAVLLSGSRPKESTANRKH